MSLKQEHVARLQEYRGDSAGQRCRRYLGGQPGALSWMGPALQVNPLFWMQSATIMGLGWEEPWWLSFQMFLLPLQSSFQETSI